MAKKKSEPMMKSTSSSGASMKMLSARQLMMIFIVFLIGHVAVLYFANRYFPDAIVLGTHFFKPMQALVYSMVVFTLITVGAIPVIEHLSAMYKRSLSNLDWMVLYFLVNAGALWLIGRFAEQLGMGLRSYMVAFVLAAVMDVVQGFLVMAVTGTGKK